MLKSAQEYEATDKKESYLIITKDSSLFNSSSPTAQFIADIGKAVAELHIIYIGKDKSAGEAHQKISENSFLYIARPFLFLSFIPVFNLIKRELVWKKRFQPNVVISIGDEIAIASSVAKKYQKPLYVFYSYIKVLGEEKVEIKGLTKARPKKIFVPNQYVGNAVEQYHGYSKEETEIKILPQYIDISKIKNIFDTVNLDEAISMRNKIFTMIVFPRHVTLGTFKMIKRISKEIRPFILKFRFFVVVGKSKLRWAKLFQKILGTDFEIIEEDKNSVNLFYQSRLMLYFENPKASYSPILYSFIAGCPVLSSGDEYSKTILFNSDLAQFAHVNKSPEAFGVAIRKFINDQYLYGMYKMNCASFAELSFSHDRGAYVSLLAEGLRMTK